LDVATLPLRYHGSTTKNLTINYSTYSLGIAQE
jgi:hypothetical protein